MNKKTHTIKIDVYYRVLKHPLRYKNLYEYQYTLNCIRIDKDNFNYYYNNYATFNDVKNLAKTADNSTTDFTPYYKFKLKKL